MYFVIMNFLYHPWFGWKKWITIRQVKGHSGLTWAKYRFLQRLVLTKRVSRNILHSFVLLSLKFLYLLHYYSGRSAFAAPNRRPCVIQIQITSVFMKCRCQFFHWIIRLKCAHLTYIMQFPNNSSLAMKIAVEKKILRNLTLKRFQGHPLVLHILAHTITYKMVFELFV
jgi:hypothetical protein